MSKRILITGGTGYIGAHTALELSLSGRDVVIIDNLSNSSICAHRSIEYLSKKEIPFIKADLRDHNILRQLFQQYEIESVLHFAAFKSVGESSFSPLKYFDNNIGAMVALLSEMNQANVRSLVFSSSATVYGEPERLPISETAPLRVTSPYGRTKLICEQILEDLSASDPRWRVAILRYFNPIGAHSSGLIGDQPNGTPNNLMPYLTKVACGELEFLNIFGGDYPTEDGTGVRDYIHVVDVARGHQAALAYLERSGGINTFNLGTGKGISVRELLNCFVNVNGVKVPYRMSERRLGDVSSCYADVRLAKQVLGWESELSIDQMCADAWNWEVSRQERNKSSQSPNEPK